MTGSKRVPHNVNTTQKLRQLEKKPSSDRLALRSFDDLKSRGDVKIKWLWKGYLAAGDITLLTSQWKTGKTTEEWFRGLQHSRDKGENEILVGLVIFA